MHGMAAHAIGLSNVLGEAMACEIPITASAFEGLHGNGDGEVARWKGYHNAALLISPSVKP